MDGYGDGDFFYIGGHGGQVDDDGFVVAVACAGAVVAGVLHCAVVGFALVVKHKVGIGTYFARCGKQERAAVQIKICAVGGAHVPA